MIWKLVVLFLIFDIVAKLFKKEKEKPKKNKTRDFLQSIREKEAEKIKVEKEKNKELYEKLRGSGRYDEAEKYKPKEPQKKSEEEIRSFYEIFPRTDYTLDEIRQMERGLSEREYLAYRYKISDLEYEARKRETEMEELIDIETTSRLSPLQQMVVYKEILDRPISRR